MAKEHTVPTKPNQQDIKRETMILKFSESDGIKFHQVEDGMEVEVKVQQLPDQQCNTFTDEYMEFLRVNGVSDFVAQQMYEGVQTGMRRGMAMEALMDAMK